jgi:hypothetical protein
MDFVQRNLINERNNLQIELTKANLVIAQLNELSNKTLGSYIKKAAGVNTEPGGMSWSQRNDIATLDNDAGHIADSGSDPSRVLNTLKNRKEGIGRAVDQLTSRLVDAKYKRLVPKPTNEQAEYISRLENTVIALAESMNMSVEELMEMDSWRSMKKMKDIAIAVTNGTAKPLGNGIPAANKLAERIGNRLYAMGVMGAHGEDGKIHIYDQGTAHEHNIKFNNLPRDIMKDGERRAHAENDKAREARVAAKNAASKKP